MTRDLLIGPHAVGEWLASSPERLEALLVAASPNDRIQALARQAAAANIPVEIVSTRHLQSLAEPKNPQGVAARVKPYAFADLDAVLAAAGGVPLVLAVDGVTDPGNLGALIRSAAFFGATAVLLPRDRSASITPVVERAAAGAVARIPICQVNSFVNALAGLREVGYSIVGGIVGPHPSPSGVDLRSPLVAVVGSEGSGIRPSVRRLCDLKVSLPSPAGAQRGPASLNVSAFTSILLYEIARQRAA